MAKKHTVCIYLNLSIMPLKKTLTYCFTSTFIATLQLMRQLGFSPLSNVKVFEFLYILSNAFPFDFFISAILKTPISY